MSNSLERARFWEAFILAKCPYPFREKLAANFAAGTKHDFCACGCNSFAVEILDDAGVAPLTKPGEYGMIFESDFEFCDSDRTLEILLFADKRGYLCYVEVDCCGNAFPISDAISVKETPYHTYASQTLLP
jgi:hypothetical protein